MALGLLFAATQCLSFFFLMYKIQSLPDMEWQEPKVVSSEPRASRSAFLLVSQPTNKITFKASNPASNPSESESQGCVRTPLVMV